MVLLPYEITLLSNSLTTHNTAEASFTTLWNYTTLKLSAPITACFNSFTTLWNYTTLKHALYRSLLLLSFTTLWNYTTLKHCTWRQTNLNVLLPYEITLLSNSGTGVNEVEKVLLPYEITLLSNSSLFLYFFH